MVEPVLVSRLIRYYKAQGLLKTFYRILEKLWYLVFPKANILYCVDLAELNTDRYVRPENMQIISYKNMNEIEEGEMAALTGYFSEYIIKRQMEERFDMGAVLWLLKVDDRVAGMIWSIKAKTVRPYYFLLATNDVHLFDNEIFSDYRGRGLNIILIEYALSGLRSMGLVRAFIDTNLRNTAEIRSLAKTSFNDFGLARKIHFGGRDITIWSKKPYLGRNL